MKLPIPKRVIWTYKRQRRGKVLHGMLCYGVEIKHFVEGPLYLSEHQANKIHQRIVAEFWRYLGAA